MSDGTRKIGSGHASAMARLGLRELRGAMYSGGNVAQQPEYGLYGSLTPSEISQQREVDERDIEDESSLDSILANRLQQAKDRDDRDDDSRDLDLDRE